MAELYAGERKDPVYLLTVGYVLALIIIAMMSFCIHLVLGELVKEHNNAAVIMSARQGKLSHKIALYASEYAETQDKVIREQLEDSIELMKGAHEALTSGNKALDIASKPTGELERIYFSLPYALDDKVKTFVSHAENLITLPPNQVNKDNEDYKYLIESSRGPLATALEAAIMAYEAESETRTGKLQSYQKMALYVIFATLIAEAILIFRPLVSRVRRYAERLRHMAMTDVLTGVDNSRSFMRKSMKELKSARRHKTPLSVAILDLDHFKKVNDEYGHLVGDEVLKAFTQFVLRTMRIEDEFARIGGEEFALLLPHTDLQGAQVIADRVRHIIEISPFHTESGKSVKVTVSIGVAEVDPESADFEIAMDAADKALYKAKQEGRNKVVCSELYASSSDNVVSLPETRQETS